MDVTKVIDFILIKLILFVVYLNPLHWVFYYLVFWPVSAAINIPFEFDGRRMNVYNLDFWSACWCKEKNPDSSQTRETCKKPYFHKEPLNIIKDKMLL